MNKKEETATLAGGCFWCTEAIFKRLQGVISVLPGYSGGHIENPSYKEVCSGETGHSETIQIKFNPRQISFTKILDIFWHIHDPTTLNQQGNDIGTQYRSVIFYHGKKQKEIAERSKKEIEEKGLYPNPIVTEIIPFINFYPAEDYHKNYFDYHKGALYCDLVIAPKIEKLIRENKKLVKKDISNC